MSEGQPPQVRVVTFNTAAGNPRIKTAQADFPRLPFYREALDGADGAPLLALQEVGREQCRALRREPAAREGRVLQIRRPGLGNALVVPPRYALVASRRGYYVGSHLRGVAAGLKAALRGRKRPNWRQYGELRMWIEARLRDQTAGRELTVLVTHISGDDDLKPRQTAAIVRRARAAATRGPVILAGDFNVRAGRPRGPGEARAAALLAQLRDMGLEAPGRRSNIDYVLASGFEPVTTRIWTGDSLQLPGSSNAEAVSDHYAEDDVLRYAAPPATAMAGERGAGQLALGVRAPLPQDVVHDVRATLAAMGGWEVDAAVPPFPFAALDGVHFGRVLVLDGAAPDIPPSVFLATEVDAPLERHIDQLAERAGPALDAAFGRCPGYPVARTAAARRSFLLAHRLAPRAAYVNTVGRTLQQVRNEAALRVAIEGFVDAHRHELPEDPVAARAAIQEFVRAEPSLAWARAPAPRPPLGWRLGETAHALGVAAALLVAAPLLVVVVPVWAVVLRIHEARDEAPHVRPTPDHARALGALEDHLAQNGFSAMGAVKPGWFRRATIAAVLRAIDYAARHVFTRGTLAGVTSIHFARWTMLDGDRRAIFTSNYDGSLESYMDDFIDKVAFGLNASFSHGVGFPRTRWLFFEGARREEEFKDYLRAHQVPTPVWYSAYGQLSARNLANNALIRSGLWGAMSRADAATWLRRL